MQVTQTPLEGVLILEPRVFGDDRGWFYESFNARTFAERTGHSGSFVQDNHSRSVRGVLRGIHFQTGAAAQGKLVRATRGEVFDVAVDLRESSQHFGEWTGVWLSADNKRQLWVPAGFGHAFLVASDVAEVQYKVDAYYSAEAERSLRWDDPAIAVDWPDVGAAVSLSEKDRTAPDINLLKLEGDLFD